MNELQEYIEKIIKDTITANPNHELFDEPIIGYASAHDPMYDQLDEIIKTPQLHPTDFLENAQTVIVYFLPITATTVDTIQGEKVLSQEWSNSYTHGNDILGVVASNLETGLSQKGITVKSEPPTFVNGTYDSENLTSKWAHKSSAVIAGVGTFGLNHLIITKKGTAGRLGSVITDAFITPTKPYENSLCLYYKNGTCRQCVERCPSGALNVDGSFDRFRCNAYLDGKNISDFEQGCGMCSSGPCAKRGF